MQTQEKQVVKFMNSKVDPTYIWHTAKDAAVKAVDEYMNCLLYTSPSPRD